MATVEDAIELLTDPKLLAKAQRPGTHVQVRPKDVIGGLMEREAGDRGEARALVIEALDSIGGELRTSFHQGGSSARRRQEASEEFWVPRAAVRKE